MEAVKNWTGSQIRDRSRINPPFDGSSVLSEARHEEDVSPHGDSTDKLRRRGYDAAPPLRANVTDLRHLRKT